MASTLLDHTLWEQVDTIDGWLTYEEADLLYRHCKGQWCEVGSWCGKSTVVLAQKHKGYAIDWFVGSTEHSSGTNTYDDFTNNIKRFDVDKNITIVKKSYVDAASDVKKPIQLLFLDAEHTYDDTKKAFELYEPLVEKGGIIVLHDVWGLEGQKSNTPWQGVTDFAIDLLKDNRFEWVEDAHRSMAIRKK